MALLFLFFGLFFVESDNVIGDFIHVVDGTGMDVEDDMKAVFLK